MNSFHSPQPPAVIEPLESRIAPAVLGLSGSVLTYAAGSGVANDVTVVFDLFGNEYSIQDSAETIVLNAAAQAAGFTVSANGHTATGPALGLTSLTIDLANGNDEVSVIASGTPINIQGGDGEDRFHIGLNSLLFIEEDITIDGGAARDFLEISDAQTGSRGHYIVTGSSFSRSDGPMINFGSVSDVSLQGGLGGNFFQIQALNSGQSFEIQGSDGFDDFQVNSSIAGPSIAGALNIVTNGGNDLLAFQHLHFSGSAQMLLTDTTVGNPNGPAIRYAALPGDRIEVAPTFHPLLVGSLASGVEYVLISGGAPITLGLGGEDALGALRGHVTFVGGYGATLSLNDSGSSTAHEYLIGTSTFSRDGVELVNFRDLAQGTFSAGSGDDLINASINGGFTYTRFDINSGAGDDRIITSPRRGFVNAGPGSDTLTIEGISGDATLSETGFGLESGVAAVGFTMGAPEFVNLVGDNGPNTFEVDTLFSGFTILDGGGGGDTLIGGDVNILGKSVTFTDPDGDLITIQNDAARFKVANLGFLPTGSGAALSRLDLTASPKSFAEANLTITATRGALGGDGRTAVGQIIANNADLASIVIDGDLAALDVGDSDASTRALGLLKVNSLGRFGATYLPSGASSDFFFTGKAVRVEVATDFVSGILNVSGGANNSGKLGALLVGGDLAGQVYTTGRIGMVDLGNMVEGGSIIADAGARIATLIIRHEMRFAEIYADGALGSVEIGGNVTNSIIIAYGNNAPATADAALAIRSLRVGGSVTHTFIGAGFDRTTVPVNPDVTIGPVFIAGNFDGSDLVAGIDPIDGIFGNGNDIAAIAESGAFAGLVGGDPAIASRIAKVVIGGAVFGLPSPAIKHAVTAQQIDRLKIGGELFPLTDEIDNLALSLSGDIRAVEVG